MMAVADMDGNPKPHLLVGGPFGVLLANPFLYLDGALNGIDNAGEFCEDAISGGVEDPSPAPLNQAVDNVTASGERAQRLHLIALHEATVTLSISGEDRRELALDLSRRHAPSLGSARVYQRTGADSASISGAQLKFNACLLAHARSGADAPCTTAAVAIPRGPSLGSSATSLGNRNHSGFQRNLVFAEREIVLDLPRGPTSAAFLRARRGTAMRRNLHFVACFVALATCFAAQAREGHHGTMADIPHGSAGAPVSFAELKATVDALEQARAATDKFRDVSLAEAEGYQQYGPYVRGQGFHFVNTRRARAGFNVERPPILLYEKDETAPQGLRLVGVSYLIAAETGPNGQPVSPPFPAALAAWHKHHAICLFADRSIRMHLQDSECRQNGGRFIAETDWMVHAWIWKDSPAGVFSPTNPDVQ
jgi:hypothetical protein